jgi:PKD repeat protein
VTLTATNALGSDSVTKTDYITVTEPPPDFSLTATPSSRTVVRGRSTTYTVSIAPIGAFAGSVDLSVSGLPTGGSGTFDPNPVSVSGTASSTLTITTATTTKPGSYTLTIRGTSASVSHTTTVTLQVKRK